MRQAVHRTAAVHIRAHDGTVHRDDHRLGVRALRQPRQQRLVAQRMCDGSDESSMTIRLDQTNPVALPFAPSQIHTDDQHSG